MNRILLIKKIERLSMDRKLKILKWLHDQNIKIHECLDGSRINLDLIPKVLYDQLVEFIMTAIDTPIPTKFQI